MAAVFDGPVPPVALQHTPSIDLLRCTAGNATGDVVSTLSGFLMGGIACDDEGLASMGQVEVAVEPGGSGAGCFYR